MKDLLDQFWKITVILCKNLMIQKLKSITITIRILDILLHLKDYKYLLNFEKNFEK